MLTDPIADMLARIRNAARVHHPQVTCPSSRLKLGVAKVLKDEGYVTDAHVEAREGKPHLVLELRYRDDGSSVIDGIRRVSKPGCRVYVGVREIPRVRNGMGVAVLSTPKGVISDRTAREASVGGEVLCEVW